MCPPQVYKGHPRTVDQDIKKILIVEDDMTLKILWQQIVRKLEFDVKIEWATSEGSASKAVEEQKEQGGHYDLVICDIFLSGNNTGIDFWRDHRDEPTKFIFTSGVSAEKFKTLIEKENGHHLFLPKPLDPSFCILSLNELFLKAGFSKTVSGEIK